MWGDRMVWVDYIRPGFTLSKVDWRGPACQPSGRVCGDGQARTCNLGAKPGLCFVLRKHVVDHRRSGRLRCGKTGGRSPPESACRIRNRPRCGARVLPVVRGLVSASQARHPQAGRQSGGAGVSGPSRALRRPRRSGRPCPDHLVHTKRLPLFVDWASGSRRGR